MKEMDYVIFYAKEMNKHPEFFNSQKKLIESQIKSSISLFKLMFGKNFKLNARHYLNQRGLIKIGGINNE
jgi:hypothetical protein